MRLQQVDQVVLEKSADMTEQKEFKAGGLESLREGEIPVAK